jgi:hypothetical protein
MKDVAALAHQTRMLLADRADFPISTPYRVAEFAPTSSKKGFKNMMSGKCGVEAPMLAKDPR